MAGLFVFILVVLSCSNVNVDVVVPSILAFLASVDVVASWYHLHCCLFFLANALALLFTLSSSGLTVRAMAVTSPISLWLTPNATMVVAAVIRADMFMSLSIVGLCK
jgi:hypothetical protein